MLNVSIVLYNPNWQQLLPLTEELLRSKSVRCVCWIDNSPTSVKQLPLNDARLIYKHNTRNLGYGAAHNIAIRESANRGVKYHLVLNSDIVLRVNELEKMITYLQAHNDVGTLMPKVLYPDGSLQYLCKLLPSPVDVITRRLLPKQWFVHRNARYEMRASGYNKVMNVPYLSGCFMLLRVEAVVAVGLFDERFFMYPEDLDLTRRIHRNYQTIFYPDACIVHEHEKASYKSLKMFFVHATNMCRYFTKWGWFRDDERKRFNEIAEANYLSCK